ncbi:MAG: phage major capsid protein [Acidobacteria bacterium]|nr:phage major capsid protein [Acidobacteriota bacterium]
MLKSQELELRISKVRERLNVIAGLAADAVTTEIREESDTLATEYATLEPRFRAARIAEADERREAEIEFGGDSESAEIRSLIGRVALTDYLAPAAAGIGLAGAPVELAAALKVPVVGAGGGIAVPWRMLECPEHRAAQAPREDRAFTTTAALDGPTAQRPILQRLFGMDIMGALGVRIDTVPAGMTEWPLLTGGVAPTMKAEGTAADAPVAATFTTETLKPKRLTGAYEYTHEQGAQVPGIEPALRRDLGDSVRAKMSDLILNGDESTNDHEPDGFLTKITAPADPAAEATYADYAGVHATAVDGIHASREGEVSSVIGVASYQHAAAVYQAGSGESGSEALMKRGMSCMASSFVPAPAGANMIQTGGILHAAGPNGGGASMRGDSVAAVWPTLEVVRDIYSKASQGVVLTWVALWDAETAFRAAAYKRVAFRLA